MAKFVSWVLVPVALILAWIGWDLFETADELITPEMHERSVELWGKIREDGDWTGTQEEWDELWALDEKFSERWRTRESAKGAISGAFLSLFSAWILGTKGRVKG